MNEDTELNRFKREIDLRQFAASLGYQMDRRESWRGSTVLRCGPDKIIVKRNSNGHYVFFSVREDGDDGTIIDFLQRRRRLSLGAVRQILRPWIGRPVAPGWSWFPPLKPTSSDRLRVERAFERMATALRHPYLEQERSLPAALLGAPRFAGRVRIDRRKNAVFPHLDAEGLCGYEIKNRGFTGFAAGGRKGLWFSHTRPNDRRLVLAESAIDALSHAALFPDPKDQTRYASLGGRPHSRQLGLLRAAVAKLPERSEIVAAFDADNAGRALVDVVGRVVEGVRGCMDRTDLTFRAHLPVQEGEDWNEVLLRCGCQNSNRQGKTDSCPG